MGLSLYLVRFSGLKSPIFPVELPSVCRQLDWTDLVIRIWWVDRGQGSFALEQYCRGF